MEPWWWHGMGFMWIFPLIFMIIFVAFLFVIMSRGPRWFGGFWDRNNRRESAREILDRRFASGEISAEQYEDMKRRLASER